MLGFETRQGDFLAFDNMGQWPVMIKVALAVLLVLVLFSVSYWLSLSNKSKQLGILYVEENRLRQSYQTKYDLVANLDFFRAQMVLAEADFARQLSRLPNREQTSSLLDDITLIATSTGLDLVKVVWQAEINHEIYSELPMDIEVVGSYHSFGHFVSEITGLFRIITLHDFTINRLDGGHLRLRLTLQAKTYRYNVVVKE